MSPCHVFSIADHLDTVDENALYMKTIIGDTLSVSVVKFVENARKNLRRDAHRHGEEICLQLAGTCSMYTVAEDGKETENILQPGDTAIISPETMHYAVNRFGSDGISMRLNVLALPRDKTNVQSGLETTPHTHRSEATNETSIKYLTPFALHGAHLPARHHRHSTHSRAFDWNKGTSMDSQLCVLYRRESIPAAADQSGEEVCAILDGQFDIDVAGEAHSLSAGQGVLIPPHLARRFECGSASGVLYRVVMQTW